MVFSLGKLGVIYLSQRRSNIHCSAKSHISDLNTSDHRLCAYSPADAPYLHYTAQAESLL